MIREVLMNADETTDLAEALKNAYPFDDSVEARQIWLDALLRHSVRVEHQKSLPADKVGSVIV